MNLLFVCSGNTCRSPLAVAAWQAFGAPLLRGSALQGSVHASSAGVCAREGAPVSPHAQALARQWGIELGALRARSLHRALVRHADLVFAMTPSQSLSLSQFVPNVRLLGEFAAPEFAPVNGEAARLDALLDGWKPGFKTDSSSIGDPFGGSMEAYQACGAQIRRAVEGLARALHDGRLEVAPRREIS